MRLHSEQILAQQHDGLHHDKKAKALVKQVGTMLVENTLAGETPYRYDFQLSLDQTIANAFALTGGQIFIAAALCNKANVI